MVNKSSSTSTNTGIAPAHSIADTVAVAVCDTVITSSPGPISSARKAISIASVPFATPTEYLADINSENSSSSFLTFSPRI